MAALSFERVSKSYDGQHAVLENIDLSVADGEFLVIVGGSGCGKSTLLRLVAGLERISAGTIRIGDRIVNDLEPKDRGVAMVFQNYALYPHMNVYDNIAYGLRVRKFARPEIDARVREAARILELEALLARRPRDLSGGQRQRVAMGRAIVREPDVFLFDEPLSNLDAKLRVQMRLEMQQLHERLKTTTLYVTHDQVEAMTLAHRVMVLERGRIEQIGTPTEIYEQPATTFVAAFIGSPGMNLMPGANGAILGIRPEHIALAGDGAGDAALTVTNCELLGADTLVHGRWDRHELTVRLPHEQRPARGEVLPLYFPPARMHRFDAGTGRRIAS